MDGRLNFKATIDDADFNRKLNNMEKGVDGLKFDAPTKSLDGLNKKLLETKQRLQENQNELKRLNTQISTTAPGAVQNNLLRERNALSRSINEDKAAVIGYKQEITNLNRELGNTARGGNALKSTLSSLTSYFGALIGIGTVISLLRSFYDTTKQLQVLNKSMELGAKDSQAYASNISFLSDITEKYGLELISTSQAYNKFYTASKNKLDLEQIQLIFEKISKSASLMGMSVADQAGIFRALEQMMSKGTVQAEELRGQLGDRLPGAFEIMANAMGVSTEKLGDMMKNGEVMSADVLPKFAIELEKAFGADKVEMVDNLVASENRLKNAWTDFVAEVNGTDNAIGNFIISFMGAISTALKGLSRLSASWDSIFKTAREQGAMSGYEGAKIDYTDYDKFESQRKKALQERQQLLKKERELTQDLKDGQEALAKADERRIMPTWLGGGAVTKDANKNLEKINRQLGYTQDRIRAINELEQKYQNPEKEINTETEIERRKREAEEKRALKQAESLAKKRLDFIFELQKAENDLTQSTLSGLDLEKSKIEEVYQTRLKKAKELGANQEALNKIESLKTKETEIATYRLDTTTLTTSLEQQKKDYEDFENFKKQVGIEEATKMYSGIIDVSKTYYDTLNEELNSFSGRNLTDVEKERVAALFKLLQDYSIQKQENERKSLEEILVMTQSFEQKILNLRAEYDAKRRKLTEDSTIADLESRLAILDKEFQEKARELISGFADEKGFGTAITQGFIGATKQIITAQIESLRNYLKNAKDLTKSQIDEIEKLISGLDEKLYQATDDGSGGALRMVNNQIAGLKKSVEQLEKAKKFYEALGLPQTAVILASIEAKIKGINVQIEGMAGQKAKAISDEFGKISNIFSSLAGDFETMGGGANNIFKSLSKVAGIASTVSNLFSEMKAFNEAQKSEGGASFSQTMGAAGGLMSAVFGISSMIMGVLDDYKRSVQAAEIRRIESYIKSLEFERELAALETERLRRNALSISDKQKEADSIDREILLKQKQLMEIQEKLNLFASQYLMTEMPLFGDKSFTEMFGDVGDLQVYYDKLKEMRDLGQEMTQQQKEQLAYLDAFWLGNRSWEDLQRVLNNLKGSYTHDEMRASVEQAIKVAKELEEAGYSLEDVQNMMRELATGTSAQDLSNQLADAFRNGEDAVISFGNTMEEVLKNAIIEAFKNEFIIKEMDKLFKLFGDMGMDGEYTKEELDKIREESEKSAARLQTQWDALYGSLEGFDFGGDFGAGAADGIKRITETQADRLTGILSGMQVDVIASRQILSDSRNLLSSSLDNLIAIEFNTRATADNTYQMVQILQNNQAKALGMI